MQIKKVAMFSLCSKDGGRLPFAIKKFFVSTPPFMQTHPSHSMCGYPWTMASNTSHNNLRSSYVPRSNVTAIINETHLLRESFNVSWIVAALENISLRRTRLNVAERRPGYVHEFREHRGRVIRVGFMLSVSDV